MGQGMHRGRRLTLLPVNESIESLTPWCVHNNLCCRCALEVNLGGLSETSIRINPTYWQIGPMLAASPHPPFLVATTASTG